VTRHQDIIALYDQVQAEIRQQARVVAAYFKQLRDEGMEEDEAMQLTLAFQQHFVFAAEAAEPEEDDGD
jgi:hypothetical protein